MLRRTCSDSRDHVVPRHRRRAGGRAQQRGQHPQGGRLAGAVGSEEPDHLTLRDVEVDAVDGPDLGGCDGPAWCGRSAPDLVHGSRAVPSAGGGSSADHATDTKSSSRRRARGRPAGGRRASHRVAGMSTREGDATRGARAARSLPGVGRDDPAAGAGPAGLGRRQDVLRADVLRAVGVDAAAVRRERPDPGAEDLLLARRRAARRRRGVRRPGRPLARRRGAPSSSPRCRRRSPRSGSTRPADTW